MSPYLFAISVKDTKRIKNDISGSAHLGKVILTWGLCTAFTSSRCHPHVNNFSKNIWTILSLQKVNPITKLARITTSKGPVTWKGWGGGGEAGGIFIGRDNIDFRENGGREGGRDQSSPTEFKGESRKLTANHLSPLTSHLSPLTPPPPSTQAVNSYRPPKGHRWNVLKICLKLWPGQVGNSSIFTLSGIRSSFSYFLH